MQFVEKIGKTFNKTGKDVLQLVDATQIKKRIEEEKEKQKKAYVRLGEKYYEQIKENPPEEFDELTREILKHQKVIEEYLEQLNKLNKHKNCSYCGAALIDGALYCVQCGKEIKKDVAERCPFCGGNIEEQDVYCSGCGKKIER